MNRITVYEEAAAVKCKRIQELAKSLYEELTELREIISLEKIQKKIPTIILHICPER